MATTEDATESNLTYATRLLGQVNGIVHVQFVTPLGYLTFQGIAEAETGKSGKPEEVTQDTSEKVKGTGRWPPRVPLRPGSSPRPYLS